MNNLYKCFNCKHTPCNTPDICNKVSEDFLKSNKIEMNNTLTAKEWLEKEITTFDDSVLDGMMEQYASYRIKELEEKIVEFRDSFSRKFNYLCDGQGNDAQDDVENFIDQYFNITSETKGNIN